jgi:hypothetical protein
MNMLILNSAKKSELATLNASGEPTLQLCALPLVSGDAALTAELLGDCGEGQTWEHYGSFLQTLPISDVSPGAFQEIQLT